MKKKTKNILIAAGIIALVFFAMKAFHKKPVVPMPPRPVETALAVREDTPVYIESFGNFVAPFDVDIKAQVTGAIKEYRFTDGTEIKKGDILCIIDPAPYKAQLDQANAVLMQSKADLELKKKTFDRNKALFEKELISKQENTTPMNKSKRIWGSKCTNLFILQVH